MAKMLLILEVSGKQGYIFGSRKLKENVQRSADIRRVTESTFFREVAGALYDEERNMVNFGGGHTILWFDAAEDARHFAACVTEAAMRRYPGMELFAATYPYDETKTTGDNFRTLFEQLEKKKARRESAFRRIDFGFDAKRIDGPVQPITATNAEVCGHPYPTEFTELAGGDPFIAVIHIDGNCMGKRVDAVYERYPNDPEMCRAALRRFSEGIDADFHAAFEETVETLIGQPGVFGDGAGADAPLPIRSVIQAGDDVCFVTAGKYGLECARTFLERLSLRTIPESGEPYSACAGVALVHTKYPFHRAYDLAEELCDSAKQFGREIDGKRRISAMDWHIEFGQLRENLAELRRDYVTEAPFENGNESVIPCRMELRPVTVVIPQATIDGAAARTEELRVRSYQFFRGMCSALTAERGRVARGKLKELRTVLKQGVTETEHYLKERQISELLYHVFSARYQGQEMAEQLRAMVAAGDAGTENNTAFTDCDGTLRSLFFDAVEMMDHCTFFEEVT